jgi:hypothetical protein
VRRAWMCGAGSGLCDGQGCVLCRWRSVRQAWMCVVQVVFCATGMDVCCAGSVLCDRPITRPGESWYDLVEQ